ncbi:MAG: bifunctional UDP-N-acetylglucosamine diphosphorylase/glucosamine-1-phosphate N-acetyltransferase GlmU, partial [Armatimonadota bacterium]
GAGCRIEPGSHILGRASVGARTVIGPNTVFKDAIIGEDGAILMSYVDRAVIGDRVKVGPFANLRPGTRLADGVRIGNFVEVKNAALGPRAKANHLSYIGDASVGSESNIGAGTITCNYDGFEKHATEIGANVFVGSNSTLVAPLTIGDGAMVTAGSVVTQNVGAGDAAFGRARQENKSGWVEAWRQRRAMYRNRGSEQATFPVLEMPTEATKPKETSS